MGTIHRSKSMLTSEPALLGHFDGQMCRAFRTVLWFRAQYALLTSRSVLSAFPCLQAEFPVPSFVNYTKLLGPRYPTFVHAGRVLISVGCALVSAAYGTMCCECAVAMHRMVPHV